MNEKSVAKEVNNAFWETLVARRTAAAHAGTARRASQRLLETGSLPLQAKRRLSEETVTGHPLFTSDLSTREFSLTCHQGYQPLSQVMGSSIYHIGRRDPYLSSIRVVEAESVRE